MNWIFALLRRLFERKPPQRIPAEIDEVAIRVELDDAPISVEIDEAALEIPSTRGVSGVRPRTVTANPAAETRRRVAVVEILESRKDESTQRTRRVDVDEYREVLDRAARRRG